MGCIKQVNLDQLTPINDNGVSEDEKYETLRKSTSKIKKRSFSHEKTNASIDLVTFFVRYGTDMGWMFQQPML